MDHYTIVIAALWQIGTEDAFIKSQKVMTEFLKIRKSTSRIIQIFQLFAIQSGHYDIAIDVFQPGKVNDMNDNIRCIAMLHSGELSQTLNFLSDAVQSPKRRWKMLIFPDLMDLFIEKVKESKDEGLKKQFVFLCQELDRNATLTEKTISESLLHPIGGNEEKM